MRMHLCVVVVVCETVAEHTDIWSRTNFIMSVVALLYRLLH